MSNMNDELDRLIKDLDILRINIASMAARVEAIQQSLTMLKSQPAEAVEPQPQPQPELQPEETEEVEEPLEETVPTESSESESDDEAIAEAAEEEEAEDAGEPEEPDDSDEPDESDDSDEPEQEEPVAPTRELRRFFTINDGYRFRRELFGNSDTEMADTINMIEAMSNMAEAQDYVFSDLGWDADNEEVQAFLEIVDRYFKER